MLNLADELISATRTPQFSANVASLATDFEQRIAPYETAYFAAMSNGGCCRSSHHLSSGKLCFSSMNDIQRRHQHSFCCLLVVI
jgi:hypothetical protein